jgi:hypothetical protein
MINLRDCGWMKLVFENTKSTRSTHTQSWIHPSNASNKPKKGKREVKKKSREDEGGIEGGEREREREREDVGELAGCPRKMAVVGGDGPLQLHPQFKC